MAAISAGQTGTVDLATYRGAAVAVVFTGVQVLRRGTL